MNSEKELNSAILQTIITLKQTFPELQKFLGEMPIKISYTNDKEITLKNLKDYYESLQTLLKNYIVNHKKINSIRFGCE